MIFSASSSLAQDAPTTRPQDRHGAFHISFAEQSPLSPIEAQNRRYHIKIEAIQRYNLAAESFEAFIPEDYAPDQSYGLFVWVNAGNNGSAGRNWQPILNKQRLIWIGANNSGNERGVGVRLGLALDAVHNFKKLYNVDESRIYVGGVSGGGKIASMLAMIYPEIFTGAIPASGVAYFRNIQLRSDPSKSWPAVFDRPPAAAFDLARRQGRFVLLTGSNDFNRDSIKDIYERGFLTDGFQHVQYVEVPGQGHGVPDMEWIDQAIKTLDAPLPQMASEWFSRAQLMERNRKFDEALKLYQQVEAHASGALAAKATQSIDRIKSAATRPASPGQ